jgi:TonB family protein
MDRLAIEIVLFGAGLICIGGAWFEWHWFMSADNARPFIDFVGRNRARLAYGFLGLFFLACAALFIADVFRLPDNGTKVSQDIPRTIQLPTGETRTIVKRVDPEYPDSLRERGVEGDVLVRIWVAPEGTVMGTQIRSSPNDELSAAAMSAVRQWVFSPSQEPKPLVIEIPIHFGVK